MEKLGTHLKDVSARTSYWLILIRLPLLKRSSRFIQLSVYQSLVAFLTHRQHFSIGEEAETIMNSE
jgi:hypothetical protein